MNSLEITPNGPTPYIDLPEKPLSPSFAKQSTEFIDSLTKLISSLLRFIESKTHIAYCNGTRLLGKVLWIKMPSAMEDGFGAKLILQNIYRNVRSDERLFRNHLATLEKALSKAGCRDFVKDLAQVKTKTHIFDQTSAFGTLLNSNPAYFFQFLEHGSDACVKFTCNHCSLNKWQKDNDGNALLHLLFLQAKETVNPKTLQRCLELGLNPNLRNNKGMTPLHFCTSLGDSISAKLLLRAGANPVLKNNKGQTPCAYAMQQSAPTAALHLIQNKVTKLAVQKRCATTVALDAHHAAMPLRLKGTRALQHAGSTSNGVIKTISSIERFTKKLPLQNKIHTFGQITTNLLQGPAAIVGMLSVPLTLAALLGSITNAKRKKDSHSKEVATLFQEIETLQNELEQTKKLGTQTCLFERLEQLYMRLWYTESYFKGQRTSHKAEICRETINLIGRGTALGLDIFAPTHPMAEAFSRIYTPWMTGLSNVMTLGQNWGQNLSVTSKISQLDEVHQSLEANKTTLAELLDDLPVGGFNHILTSLKLRQIEKRLKDVKTDLFRSRTIKKLYTCSTVGQVGSLIILPLAASEIPYVTLTAQVISLTCGSMPSIASASFGISNAVRGLFKSASNRCFPDKELRALENKEAELSKASQKQDLEAGVSSELNQTRAELDLCHLTLDVANQLGMTRQELTLELDKLEAALDSGGEWANKTMLTILFQRNIDVSSYDSQRRQLILQFFSE